MKGEGHRIYMGHRVLPEIPMRYPEKAMAITTDYFERQCAAIAEQNNAISLRKMIAQVGQKDAGNHQDKVALTFDDGYRDNIEYALPLLERYNIPATIFVTTGFIDGTTCPVEPVLWDRAEDFEHYDAHRRKFKKMSPGERVKALPALSQADIRSEYTRHFMSWKELRELIRHPLIDIGAHTVTHPVLSRLSPLQQWREIYMGHRRLRAMLRDAPILFAYPYGSCSASSLLFLAMLGYKGAVTTRARTYRKATSLFAQYKIPRFDFATSGIA